jgi:hypothetical protein
MHRGLEGSVGYASLPFKTAVPENMDGQLARRHCVRGPFPQES